MLPQLPIVIYLSFAQQQYAQPLDTAIGIPLVIMLVLQLRYGLAAARALIRKQTADFFRLCHEEALAKGAATRRARAAMLGSALQLQSAPLSPSSDWYGAGGGGGGVGTEGTPRGIGGSPYQPGQPGVSSGTMRSVAGLSEHDLDRAMSGVGARAVAREGVYGLQAAVGLGSSSGRSGGLGQALGRQLASEAGIPVSTTTSMAATTTATTAPTAAALSPSSEAKQD